MIRLVQFPEPDLTVRPRAPWEPRAFQAASLGMFVVLLLLLAQISTDFDLFGALAFVCSIPLLVEGALVFFNVRDGIYVIEGSSPGNRPRFDARHNYRSWMWRTTRGRALSFLSIAVLGFVLPFRI